MRNLQAPALAAALVTRAFFADFVRRDSGAIVQIISPGRWPVLAMHGGRGGAGGGDVCGGLERLGLWVDVLCCSVCVMCWQRAWWPSRVPRATPCPDGRCAGEDTPCRNQDTHEAICSPHQARCTNFHATWSTIPACSFLSFMPPSPLASLLYLLTCAGCPRRCPPTCTGPTSRCRPCASASSRPTTSRTTRDPWNACPPVPLCSAPSRLPRPSSAPSRPAPSTSSISFFVVGVLMCR